MIAAGGGAHVGQKGHVDGIGLAELALMGMPAMIGVQLQPFDQDFGFHAFISTRAGSITAANTFMASTWAATS